MARLIKPDDRQVIEALQRDEGWRALPYLDSKGVPTIGWGTNLHHVTAGELVELFKAPGNPRGGITKAQGLVLLRHDLSVGLGWLSRRYTWFKRLSQNRQRVVLQMVYNLGHDSFTTFRRMIRAMREGNYAKAADEMLDSKWHVDVGARARRLAAVMRSG